VGGVGHQSVEVVAVLIEVLSLREQEDDLASRRQPASVRPEAARDVLQFRPPRLQAGHELDRQFDGLVDGHPGRHGDDQVVGTDRSPVPGEDL